MPSQSKVFDPGKSTNRIYFQKNCKVDKPAKYLIKETVCLKNAQRQRCKTFFDEGADFCGITEAFVRKHHWENDVVDLGHFAVTYANGKTEQVPNRILPLKIVVDEMEPFVFDFNICFIPNKCDLMLGVPWKRAMVPIIDWETDKIYSKKQYEQELRRWNSRSRPSEKQSFVVGAEVGQSSKLKKAPEWPAERSFHYCARWGFTKHISLKAARKLMRNPEVEFVAILPPETVNALYAEVLLEQGFAKAVVSAAVATEKQQRQLHTDLESFKDNPGYSLLEEFSMIFKTELPVGPPVHGEHEMEIKEGTGAVYRQQWRLSPSQESALREWTKMMLKAGLIRPSKSPHAAPTFCIKKAVGWRVVHDYRAMNERTVRQSSPMPRKDSIFDRMSGSFWLSCFDLLSGYYQLRMREKDIPFTAFQTPDGLFEYIAIPMGLSNAPATFNRIVQGIFADLRDFSATYFDDIYVFTKQQDVESHLAAVRKVFERCRDKKLYLKLAKSTLCAAEIPCLGDFVGRDGVRIDPDKVRVIQEWPEPRAVRDLQSFLGTTVYVQKFCRSYSEMSAPLFELVKSQKKRAFSWTSEHRKAFEELKGALCNTPVLALPDFSKPFGMRTDASRFAVGGVLFQHTENRVERPIAFCGRKMKVAELNYPTHEQEMLAIVHCLNIWRIYLFDGGCLVETDHHSLERVLTQRKINRRICRWYDLLSEFNLRFRYIPGTTNTVANAMSRRPDFAIDFVQQKQRQMNAARRLQQKSLLTMIRLAQKNAGFGGDNLPEQPRGNAKFVFFETENLIRWVDGEESRIFIPQEATELQNTILWELHDIASAGHPGIEKTIASVKQRFYWKRMHRTVRNYVATCESCQRNKHRTGKAPGLLHPLEIPTGRWTSIGMDFITGLPETTNGYDTILAIADRLTKRAHFVETISTITAEDLAELFVKVYVRHHGLPSDIISDRDSKFTSKFWSACAKLLGTKLKLASAHHQRTDGQVERINGILSSYLRHYVSGFQDDWDHYLALAEFAYNNRYQSSIEMSPFVADLGYSPKLPTDLALPDTRKEPATKFVAHLESILRAVQAQLRSSAEKMKLHYDRGRRDQKFEVGEMVLISTKDFNPTTVGAVQRKFASKWIGPYEVLKVHHDGASYEVNLPRELQIHPVFHTMVLRNFVKDTSGCVRDSTVPTVRLKDGSEGHLIEKIIDHRIKRDGTEQYKCKWVGRWDDITWEPTVNLLSVPGLIREYHRKANGLPTRTSQRILERNQLFIQTIRQWPR